MASEKNGEDRLLACLMVSWDQDRISNSQLHFFSLAVVKKYGSGTWWSKTFDLVIFVTMRSLISWSSKCLRVRCGCAALPAIMCSLTWSLSPLDRKGFLEVRCGVASCHTVVFMAWRLLIIPEVFLDVDSLSFWVFKGFVLSQISDAVMMGIALSSSNRSVVCI